MAVPELDPKTLRRVQDHARIVGVSADFVLNHVMNKWLDESGDYLAERIKNKRQRKLQEAKERREVRTKIPRIRPHLAQTQTAPIHAGL